MPHDDADAGDAESDSEHDDDGTGGMEPAITTDLPEPESLTVDLPEPESLAVDLTDPDALTVDLPEPEAVGDLNLPEPDGRPPTLDFSERDALTSPGAFPAGAAVDIGTDLRQAHETLTEIDAALKPLQNPTWTRELQGPSQHLAEMLRTVQPAPTFTTSPALRELQDAARVVAAQQSAFSAAFRASMAAPAALAGLAAVTEPTMTVSPAVDPVLFESVVVPRLQETATAIQAVGPLASAALPSVEPLLAAVRQPAFQQLVEMIESLATMPVPAPSALIDEQVLQQATLVAEQLDVVTEPGGVAASGGESVGTTGGLAPEAGPQSGAANQHGFWSPARPAEPAPGGRTNVVGVTQWTLTQLSAHSAEIRGAVAGGAAGVGFHHLSQLYPSHQATIGYVEPIVGAIVTIAVAVALADK